MWSKPASAIACAIRGTKVPNCAIQILFDGGGGGDDACMCCGNIRSKHNFFSLKTKFQQMSGWLTLMGPRYVCTYAERENNKWGPLTRRRVL